MNFTVSVKISPTVLESAAAPEIVSESSVGTVYVITTPDASDGEIAVFAVREMTTRKYLLAGIYTNPVSHP